MSNLYLDKSESNARLVRVEGDPSVNGFKLFRNWQKRHSQSVDTLAQKLQLIKSYTNPKADRLAYNGKFVVKTYSTPVDGDEAYTIEQELTKVRSVTSDTDLLNPLIEREKESIHPFGNGTGTGWGIVFKYENLDPSSDTKCMVLKDTALVAHKAKVYAKPSGDSYTLVDRKTAIEDDRTATFYMLFQRKNRSAFPGAHKADFVETTNKGRKNEIRRKYWYGINRSAHASTLSAVEGATDTGFVMIDAVKFSDDDNGAKEYVLTEQRSWTDTRTDSDYTNPQNIVHVATQTKHTEWHNQTAVQSNPSITSGYKFVKSSIKIDPSSGLIEQLHLQEKAAPSNAVDTKGKPTTIIVVGKDKGRGSTDIDCAFTSKTELADDIPTAKGPLAVSKLSMQDTQYVVSSVRYQDKGNGAGRVERERTKVNYARNFYVQSKRIRATSNEGAKTYDRQWPKIWDSYADVICGVRGFANQSWYADSVGGYMSNVGFTRTRHYDGTSTVTQHGLRSGDTNTVSIDHNWRNYDTHAHFAKAKWRHTRSYTGAWKDSSRLAHYTRYYLQTTSVHKANDFANLGGRIPIQYAVTPLARGRYVAWCITRSWDPWKTDKAAWSDEGTDA